MAEEIIGGCPSTAMSSQRTFLVIVEHRRHAWRWEASVTGELIAEGHVHSPCDLGEPETCQGCGDGFEAAFRQAGKVFEKAFLDGPESDHRGHFPKLPWWARWIVGATFWLAGRSR